MEKENKTFRLLYVIGIILVVTSHTAGGVFGCLQIGFRKTPFTCNYFSLHQVIFIR